MKVFLIANETPNNRMIIIQLAEMEQLPEVGDRFEHKIRDRTYTCECVEVRGEDSVLVNYYLLQTCSSG